MPNPSAPTTGIDPRGPRFGAVITSIVLAIALIAGPMLGVWVMLLQLGAFASGALLGVNYQPYGWVFRRYVRPRIGAPVEFEDPAPPRFAQAVGLVFAVVSVIGAVAGVEWLFYLAAGFALVAALLNAIFDFCLGCEMYLLGRRLARRVSRPVGA